MALIKCTECGRDVSENAASCPNCGNPISVSTTPSVDEQEEYLCCPRCRSKNLISNKQGFGAWKALAGGLIAGPIGLLAGGINSNKIVLTCQNCCNQFPLNKAKVILLGKTKEDFDRRIVGIVKKRGGGSMQISLACEEIKKRLHLTDHEALDYIRRLEVEYHFKANRKTSTADWIIGVVVGILFLLFFFWIFF